MYRIFGLGNIGNEYKNTPHNIGKEVLENFLDNNKLCFTSRNDKKRKSKIFQGKIFDEKVELIFYDGYMNNSGDVFNGVFTKENDGEKEKVIIIHDDIDLPFGEFRISFNRGSGGHNGVKDIIKKLKGKDFVRIRIGVCPLDFFGKCRKPKNGSAVNKYLVDKKLSKKYTEKYTEYAERLEKILKEIFENGVSSAMNRFN